MKSISDDTFMLPCPFCGGKPFIAIDEIDFVGWPGIACNDCGASIPAHENELEPEAAKRWNARGITDRASSMPAFTELAAECHHRAASSRLIEQYLPTLKPANGGEPLSEFLERVAAALLSPQDGTAPPRGELEPWQIHLHEQVYAVAVRVTGDQPEASKIADAALRAALLPGQSTSEPTITVPVDLMIATTVSCSSTDIIIQCDDHETKDALMAILTSGK